MLAGLEHLDDRYLKAVGYATKSNEARGGLPKMILVGDIVGDDEDAVARVTSEVVRIANTRGGEGFVAVSAEARRKFWLDRKRTAAISRHTNAFKINEDVVIPLPRMGEYTEGIERINIELSLRNKIALADALEAFFAGGRLPLGRATTPAASPDAELLEDRVQQALALVREVRAQWQAGSTAWTGPTRRAGAASALLQDHTLRVVEDQLLAPLADGLRWLGAVADRRRRVAIHKGVLRAGLGRAAHARRRRQRAHQHPGQQRRLRMLQTAHGAVKRASWRSPARSAA